MSRSRSSASAVLRAVLEHGPVARSTVARLTGLSPASVTDYCARFGAAGLVREVAPPVRAPSVGRPHVPLDVDGSGFVVGGVHVAVPYTTVALLDLRGQVLARARIDHDIDHDGGGPDPARLLARAGDALLDLLAEHAPDRTALGVGVAAGGWVDPRSGTVVEHALLGWSDVPVRELLGGRTRLPVHVDGHSRALLRAERLFGRARGSESVLHLFAGNVVDAAFAVGDQVHYGPRSQAGAVAHLPLGGGTHACRCGRTGCLQAEVSERTLVRRAREAGVAGLAGRPDPTLVLAAAGRGDRAAVRLLVERARLVGRAVGLLADLLNPDTVIVTELGSLHREDCLAALREEAGTDRAAAVLPTSFGDRVLEVAGGAVALDVVYRDPLAVLDVINSETPNIDTARARRRASCV